jgi:hypothetical protein
MRCVTWASHSLSKPQVSPRDGNNSSPRLLGRLKGLRDENGHLRQVLLSAVPPWTSVAPEPTLS